MYATWRRFVREARELPVLPPYRPEREVLRRWRRDVEAAELMRRKTRERQNLVLAVRRWRLRGMWAVASSQLSASQLLQSSQRRVLRRLGAVLTSHRGFRKRVKAATARGLRNRRQRGFVAFVGVLLRARSTMDLAVRAGSIAMRRSLQLWRRASSMLAAAGRLGELGGLVYRRTALRHGLAQWERGARLRASWEEMQEGGESAHRGQLPRMLRRALRRWYASAARGAELEARAIGMPWRRVRGGRPNREGGQCEGGGQRYEGGGSRHEGGGSRHEGGRSLYEGGELPYESGEDGGRRGERHGGREGTEDNGGDAVRLLLPAAGATHFLRLRVLARSLSRWRRHCRSRSGATLEIAARREWNVLEWPVAVAFFRWSNRTRRTAASRAYARRVAEASGLLGLVGCLWRWHDASRFVASSRLYRAWRTQRRTRRVVDAWRAWGMDRERGRLVRLLEAHCGVHVPSLTPRGLPPYFLLPPYIMALSPRPI